MNPANKDTRPGVACDANGQAERANVEVMDRDPGAPMVAVGPVAFDTNSIFRSPCFWLLLGIGVGVGFSIYIRRED